MTNRQSVLITACLYFLGVFLFAFALGAARVIWLVPRWGELRAVAAELPLTLLASWLWAAHLLRTRPPAGESAALAVGLCAFVLLIGAELGGAMLLLGESPAQWFARLHRPAGLLGLAGQVLFALIPWAWLACRPLARSTACL